MKNVYIYIYIYIYITHNWRNKRFHTFFKRHLSKSEWNSLAEVQTRSLHIYHYTTPTSLFQFCITKFYSKVLESTMIVYHWFLWIFLKKPSLMLLKDRLWVNQWHILILLVLSFYLWEGSMALWQINWTATSCKQVWTLVALSRSLLD